MTNNQIAREPRQIPMLFNPAMVLAMLDGRKTETRRIAKRPTDHSHATKTVPKIDQTGAMVWWDGKDPYTMRRTTKNTRPGDLIWVKEAHFAWGYWRLTGEKTRTGKDKIEFVRDRSKRILFDAGSNRVQSMENGFIYGLFKRSSLFMEKADSRLTLRVTGFNIERLHDITGEAALAEGVEEMPRKNWHHDRPFRDYLNPDGRFYDTRNSYASLWDSINGPGAWDQNPWVEVTKFEVIHENINQIARGAQRGT